MPINKIKNFEGTYMKINEITAQKTGITKEKEVRSERGKINVTNEKEPVRVEDRVRISAKTVVESARAKASNLPEVREEKVAQLREKIQSGTYQVSNREIARAMIGTLLSELA
ncbi:MAG: flagellar biosynthesis anti-sigma factor FlgM [Caldimicrobium sp.]